MAREGTALSLPFVPPYDWAQVSAYLAGRAIPGVEVVTADAYRRTVRLGGRDGLLSVRPEADALVAVGEGIDVAGGSAQSQTLVARLRRLFDLDADPAAIAAGLGADPVLARLVAARPGLRVPGAFDGFELAVRAILGQQVSVAAATRLSGRLVAAFGSPAGRTAPGLDRIFPCPARLADADVALALNMPRSRGAAIQRLAVAVTAAPDLLAPAAETGQSLDRAVARLTALRGIGPWTAHYVAMRGLREPDALPPGDVGLMRALDTGTGRPDAAGLLARSAAWRPWRAYAAMHLWTADAGR